jgi:hypothetical protein
VVAEEVREEVEMRMMVGVKVQSTSKLVGAKNKNCNATSHHMKLT